MLVDTKAKVGVFSIALGAYLPQFPSLVPEFQAQYEAFKKTLPDTVEIIDGRNGYDPKSSPRRPETCSGPRTWTWSFCSC